MVSEQDILKAGILIVDDEPSNVYLMENMLQFNGYSNLYKTTDPEKVVPLYHELQPDLILLDLNMPQLDGFQIMEELKKTDSGSSCPIMVITALGEKNYLLKALGSGAVDFLTKPFSQTEILLRIRNLLRMHLLQKIVRNQNLSLEETVRSRNIELRETQLEVIRRLGRAAEYRDDETGTHIIRMSKMCALLGREAGLSKQKEELLLHTSCMHDVGKIGIPDNILLKPGRFTPEERKFMERHTTIGASILDGYPSELMYGARIIALTHHEKWDGSGYPKGLKGEDIPLEGRICAVCDVFDALVSDRVYKKAWSMDKAVEYIKQSRGTHFDPRLVDIFESILPEVVKIHKECGPDAEDDFSSMSF